METAAYLVSAAGMPNYGDEVILRAWLRYLHDHQPSRDVWVDCPEPGRAAILMRNVNPRARFVNTLWHLSRRVPSDDLHRQATAMTSAIDHLGTPELDSGLLLLRSAGSIHLVGGGYLTALWPENYAFVSAAAHLAENYGMQAHLTGAGMLPIAGGDASPIRDALRHFVTAEARDPGSAEGFDISRGYDDAALGWRATLTADPSRAPDIMILIQGDLSARSLGEETEARIVADFVDVARAAGGQSLAFLEGYPQHDGRRWGLYRERYPDAHFLPFEFVWETGFPARPGQQWLTSRFHFHLLAAAHGASGVALVTDDEYYGAKHGLLVEAGTGWTVTSPDLARSEIPAATRNPEFGEFMAEAERKKTALARHIYPTVIPIRERARRVLRG